MIQKMAKLREQARMVKWLHNFYRDTTYSNSETRRARLGNIAQDALPEKDFSAMVSRKRGLTDLLLLIFRNRYFHSENYILHRANKINRLFKSCIDDGFIERGTGGIRPTTKGTELLHFFGFIELWLNRYSTPKLIVTTIITTLFSIEVLTFVYHHLGDAIVFLHSLYRTILR